MFSLGFPLYADEPVIIPQGEWCEDNRCILSVFVNAPNVVINVYFNTNSTVAF